MSFHVPGDQGTFVPAEGRGAMVGWSGLDPSLVSAGWITSHSLTRAHLPMATLYVSADTCRK